ncbi:trypsin-1-like [Homalodisca vitripennis]|uniref:trypsin-1-like n=1 Tax=Homalodisca vitripennis TaxID=197043 RepID=UPI001EEA0FBD|nr:trypsin-1-like [Homalodisca vitripennis]KAG8293042.1 hypothetical protein J6590_027149 [Homalodisca vitripennis]
MIRFGRASCIIVILVTVHATPFEREFRSGGFPKFPLARGNLEQCGSRTVSHFAQRSGSAAIAKIVGGSTAPYGAYPWQVEIQAFRAGSHRFEHHCGGAVVGDRLVLTAAHCFANLDYPEKIRLIVGKVNLSGRDRHERTYKAEKIVIHPDFRKDGPHSNDIAIIKVRSSSEGGIHFNSHVQPICLPETFTQRVATGDWCTVTGWGAQSQDDLESLSDELQAASVPVLDQHTCRQSDVYGGRDQSILDSMVCAGVLEGGVDACGGDSGGPLACQINGKFVLAGLVSWGDGCAKKNRPGVYTRVSHFTPWIQETMAKMGL